MKSPERVSSETLYIAALIPAYNEENHIHYVLEILENVPELREIIVVDDGSNDLTKEITERQSKKDFRIKLIVHHKNLGKGQAVVTGSQATNAPFLLLLDADLNGLKPEHIRDLIRPVIDRKADMTLGLFIGGQLHTDIAHWITPFLTGQRCLRADLIRKLDPDVAKGYGVETAITVKAKLNKFRIKKIALKGVTHPSSEFHRGFPQGFIWRLNMYRQILHAWKYSGGWEYLEHEIFFEPISKLQNAYRSAKRWAEGNRSR